jgi:hypothetical protein
MKQVKQPANQPEVEASIAYLPDFAIGRQLREGVLVTVLDDTNRSGPFRVVWLMIPREVAPPFGDGSGGAAGCA